MSESVQDKRRVAVKLPAHPVEQGVKTLLFNEQTDLYAWAFAALRVVVLLLTLSVLCPCQGEFVANPPSTPKQKSLKSNAFLTPPVCHPLLELVGQTD